MTALVGYSHTKNQIFQLHKMISVFNVSRDTEIKSNLRAFGIQFMHVEYSSKLKSLELLKPPLAYFMQVKFQITRNSETHELNYLPKRVLFLIYPFSIFRQSFLRIK